MRIFEVGKREAVHRRARALIQLRQGFTLTAGNADQQLLQLVPLLCRGIFGCHQQAEHRLPSPVIRVMHGKDDLLQGNLNFLKKNAMGQAKKFVPFLLRKRQKAKPTASKNGRLWYARLDSNQRPLESESNALSN